MNNTIMLEGVVVYEGDRLELRTFLRDETFELRPTAILLDHDPRNKPRGECMYRVFGQPRIYPDGIRVYAESFCAINC